MAKAQKFPNRVIISDFREYAIVFYWYHCYFEVLLGTKLTCIEIQNINIQKSEIMIRVFSGTENGRHPD